MKVLGTDQMLQKKHKLLPLQADGAWPAFLGHLTRGFIAIIYGESGHGKTEFSLRLARVLATVGKVGWVSFEQGHGYDLQRAVARNEFAEVKKQIQWVDPLAGLDKESEGKRRGQVFLERMFAYLDKRNAPWFVFVDSLDYTEWTIPMFRLLKERYQGKVALIFLAHGEGKNPETRLAKKVKFDGQMGIRVQHYIAYNDKNRMGGRGEYIIWEEEARLRNPAYFAKLETAAAGPEKKKRGRKPKSEKQQNQSE